MLFTESWWDVRSCPLTRKMKLSHRHFVLHTTSCIHNGSVHVKGTVYRSWGIFTSCYILFFDYKVKPVTYHLLSFHQVDKKLLQGLFSQTEKHWPPEVKWMWPWSRCVKSGSNKKETFRFFRFELQWTALFKTHFSCQNLNMDTVQRFALSITEQRIQNTFLYLFVKLNRSEFQGIQTFHVVPPSPFLCEEV